MKRGAWCAVVVVALTGCKKEEAPAPPPSEARPVTAMAPTPPAPPEPALLSDEALEKQPVFTSLEEALREPEKVLRLDLSARPGVPKLQALPVEVARLVKLQSLSVADQGLTDLPGELRALKELQKLDVGGNQLAALPAVVLELPWLRALSLDGNPLTALPEGLGRLTRLESLSVARAKLGTLPKELGQLTALTELDVGGNQLAALPEELGNLRHLMTLELEHNALQQFPGFVLKLPALGILSLQFNPIQVPLGLAQVKSLSHVEVDEGQGDLDALREAMPQVGWEVHGADEAQQPAVAGVAEELETAEPEPQEEAAPAPRPAKVVKTALKTPRKPLK